MKLKIFFSVIIALSFLVAGFIIYANNILLPVKIKAKITQRLEKSFGKNVRIERLHYNIIKGLIVENLEIFDRSKEKTYLSVKEISFQFLLFPLFQKKIIIPLARVDSPRLNLTLRQDNTLNITDVLKKWPGKEEMPGFQFIVSKIDISNAVCQFRDEHTDPNYVKEITDLRIGMAIDLFGQIKFSLQGKVPNTQNTPSFVLANGKYNILRQELQCKVKLANVVVDNYLLYLKKLPLSLSKGSIDGVDLDIVFKDKQVSLKGAAAGKNLELRNEKIVFTTDVDIHPDIKYDLQNKVFDYKAAFSFSRGSLIGLDYVKEASEIKGVVNLEKDKVWSDEIKLKVLDSAVTVRGTLENFADLNLKLNASSQRVDLAKLASLLPDFPAGFTLSGNSTLNLELQGSLKKLPLDINAASEVTAVKVELPFSKTPLTDLKGLLKFSLNQLTWENLSFLYGQTACNSSGKFADFQQPNIDFKLSSEKLTLNSSLAVKDGIIKINTCAGKYLDSNFSLQGNADVQDKEKPLLNINGESDFSLKDLLTLLPAEISDKLKTLNPDGICKISGSLNGNAKDIKGWSANFKLSSDLLTIYGLKLAELSCSLTQKDGVVNIPNFNCRPYAGSINARFSLDLTPEAPAYTAKLDFSNIDLAQLKTDTQFKDKDISGLLNADLELEGTLKGAETLRGQGKVSVKNGKLWELNLLKGLGEFLFVSDYAAIVFRNAQANLIIADKALELTDFYLGSTEAELAGSGKIGFDGSLDLTLNSEINADLIKDSPDLRKFTSAVLGNILVLKISGTLREPQYRMVPSTKEFISQIKRFFSGK
jgi:hypothetical protein